MNIIKKPVKNFWKGRDDLKPLYVVIHIGEGTADQIYWTFQEEPKSSHYLVLKDGTVWQFVNEADSAWANGIVINPTAWVVLENRDVSQNRISISIEHEGMGTEDITGAQYATSSMLVREICLRNNIPISRLNIIGHKEINAAKACPGKIDVNRIVMMAAKPPNNNELPPDTLTMFKELILKLKALIEKLKIKVALGY